MYARVIIFSWSVYEDGGGEGGLSYPTVVVAEIRNQ